MQLLYHLVQYFRYKEYSRYREYFIVGGGDKAASAKQCNENADSPKQDKQKNVPYFKNIWIIGAENTYSGWQSDCSSFKRLESIGKLLWYNVVFQNNSP